MPLPFSKATDSRRFRGVRIIEGRAPGDPSSPADIEGAAVSNSAVEQFSFRPSFRLIRPPVHPQSRSQVGDVVRGAGGPGFRGRAIECAKAWRLRHRGGAQALLFLASIRGIRDAFGCRERSESCNRVEFRTTGEPAYCSGEGYGSATEEYSELKKGTEFREGCRTVRGRILFGRQMRAATAGLVAA